MSEKVNTSYTDWLSECLKVDDSFYDKPVVYEFLYGREFEEGKGPYKDNDV